MHKEQEETAACQCALGTEGPTVTGQPSRFTKTEKWLIVGLVASVGFFRQFFFSLPASKRFLTDSISAH